MKGNRFRRDSIISISGPHRSTRLQKVVTQVAPSLPRTRSSSSLHPSPLRLSPSPSPLPLFPHSDRRFSLSSQFATHGGAAVQIADRSKQGLHSQQSHESQFASPLLSGSVSGAGVKKKKKKPKLRAFIYSYTSCLSKSG